MTWTVRGSMGTQTLRKDDCVVVSVEEADGVGSALLAVADAINATTDQGFGQQGER